MHVGSSRTRRLLVGGCALLAGLAVGAPGASAHQHQRGLTLSWANCGLTDAASTTQCATADLPMDYDHPSGRKVHIAVARVPARGERRGVMFYNFGGPGGTAVDYLQIRGTSTLWHSLNEHFDIIAMDPRGVGQSTPSIDCKANQEKEGIYSVPFTTPFNLDVPALLRKDLGYIGKCLRNNGEILRHVSTANVARDMDEIRGALGEKKLNYFGFSYGTFLGATYASLVPKNYRAMLLDGPLDATGYINKPMRDLAEQTSAFERAFGRFFQACARDQTACSGFGGSDPWDAFDQLVDKANANPIPATAYTPDPRPVTGDDILNASVGELYAKFLWGELGQALSMAAHGDGSLIRELVDGSYGLQDDGSYDPGLDRYFTIGATEQRYKRSIGLYLERGDEAWGEFDHMWWNNGYVELNYGLWPAHDKDAYYGPFRVKRSSPTPLVVATTYDPATPYRGARRLVRDLGNARLITMRGDGHTAYFGESECIDTAVDAYMNDLTLPAKGTQCIQDDPFVAPEATLAAKSSTLSTNKQLRRDRSVLVARVPRG
jgi:pimeloyl-ACP methyl ester carboxylesterase